MIMCYHGLFHGDVILWKDALSSDDVVGWLRACLLLLLSVLFLLLFV